MMLRTDTGATHPVIANADAALENARQLLDAIEANGVDRSARNKPNSQREIIAKIGECLTAMVDHYDGLRVPVTGVTLDVHEATLQVGGEIDLLETVSPPDASDKYVYWESSANLVAMVDGNGVVVAYSPGSAVITVRTGDGGFEDHCDITVEPAPAP